MINKATVVINRKRYIVEIRDGKRYIDGKTVEEFIETLDPLTLIDCANLGKAVVSATINGEKINCAQTMDDFANMRG